MSTSALAELYRRGQYAAVIRELERLREGLPWEYAEAAAEAYYYGAMAHYRLDQLLPAVSLVAKALEEVHARGDWGLTGKIRFQAGEIYRRAGQVSEAQQWTDLFLSDLDRYPEWERVRGLAHYNLGLIHRQRRNFATSIHHYEQAEQLLRAVGDSVWMIRAQENLCWVLCEDGQHTRATGYLSQIDAAITELPESHDARDVRLTHLYVRGYVLLHLQQPAEAARLCQEVVTEGSGATVAQRALATWVASEAALQMGDKENAWTLVNLANQLAIEAVDSRIMNYVNDTRRKLLAPGDTAAG
ncbi:MAG TPA: hypothetical protein VGK74_22935 [Symbiobacteriaceae bacterium]